MIFYLLFIYLISESMATNSTNDSSSFDVFNKIICSYQGRTYSNSSLTVDAKNIPCECDAIIFFSFFINQSSMIDVDEKLLKSVKDLNKPVIVGLFRTERYSGWSALLSENGNANETKMLCDFAKKHNIQGYDLFRLDPDGMAVDRNVAKNIIPYIKQLKEFCPFLIIGVAVYGDLKQLKNKDIYNFKELNKVVTYFNIESYSLNNCNPKLYNGLSPITKSEPGDNYRYSMEEVVSNLKKTEICLNKTILSLSFMIYENKNNTHPTYSEMCNGGFDNSSWCVQTSQNYYDKILNEVMNVLILQ